MIHKTSSTDEKIDIIEIFTVLWGRRFFIGFVTIVGILVSLWYTSTLPKVYISSAHVLPASYENLSELTKLYQLIQHPEQSDSTGNKKNPLVGEGAVKKHFESYLSLLKSGELGKRVLESKNIKSLLYGDSSNINLDLRDFSSRLKIDATHRHTPATIVSFEANDPETASMILNLSLITAIDIFRENVRKEFSASKNQIIDSLRRKLSLSDIKQKSQLEADLTLLREGLRIAKKLGITKEDTDFQGSGRIGYSKSIQDLRIIYSQGVDAIQEEIEILEKKRASTETTTAQSIELSNAINLVQSINLDATAILPITIDSPAIPPSKAVRPDSRKITIIFTLLSLFFASAITLAQVKLKQRRN